MNNEPFVTTGEVAARLRVHRVTVALWIREGLLPAIRYRGTRKWLIREKDVDRLLEQREEQRDA